jgi:hypothetical protein
MGPFLPLFSLGVEHGFFSDGLWREVRFVPSSDSQGLMNRAGLLIRKTANGIELYYDQSRTDALKLFLEDTDGKLSFCFKVYVDDGAFKNYSEAFLSAQDALPYFESERGVREGDRIRLHSAKQVSEKDMEPIESESFSGLLGSRDLRVRPAFAVKIVFPPGRNGSLEKTLEAGPARYFLRFGPRQTYWTYYLLGPFANKHVSIVDLDEGMGFEPLGPVSLCDERPAFAFRSKAAIPLRQHSACRFQLREAGSASGKVLVRRLPVAAASQVNRQAIGGKVVSVSEVYVNG